MAALLGLDRPSAWMMIASLTVGFFAIRFAGQGFVTMAGRNMVAKWWKYHRGKVLPFSGIGVSVCFSLAPIVFYALIQATDWRMAWQILGLCSAIGFSLFGWLVFRDNPQECGLSVDAGMKPGANQKDDPEFSIVRELTRSEAELFLLDIQWNLCAASYLYNRVCFSRIGPSEPNEYAAQEDSEPIFSCGLVWGID